jgi:transcription initiation factor TFIIE subunit beta
MNIDGFDLHKFERHLNTYIHDIISLLKKNGTMTFEDIKSRTGIDLVNNYNLTKNLKNNQRIIFKDNTLSYKHTYQIKNKEDLINLISFSSEGIELSNLRDSPIDINRLLEEIKSKIIILKDNDNSEVVFYNDLEINQVDQDVRDLWIGIKVPPYQDLILQLNSAGLKKDKIQTKKKMIIKKDKNKKYKRKIKITNTHVKGLDLSGIEK